ncbi:MAG: hypothetical protein F6J87_10745 [Spirulina sp. SIO3F2]|nr:hypothetical protein [Spirulina sp. SIO3F2]
MLKLTSGDRQQLRTAITSSFRKYSHLRMFVSDSFEDVRLNDIATSQALKVAADDLIEHFEEQGTVSALILALYKERPRNPEIQRCWGDCRTFCKADCYWMMN